jgi:hypothetical protein
MRTLRFGSLIVLALVAVSAALGADVSGKWVAQIPMMRGGGTHELVFNFKADGGQLTGTVTTPRGDQAISEGKIDGDAISFTVAVTRANGGQMKFLYKGKVAGGEIKFTREREGAGRTQEFTAKRGS